MDAAVKVACVQAESVYFDRAATIDKIDAIAADVAANGARLALFPETFIPVYPSSRWARHLAGWDGGDARALYGRLARESITIPGADSDRLADIARTRGLWLAVGANELERGTIYNALLVYSPAGELALHHRKLMPTNHERLVWGLGSGTGLEAIETDAGKVGGLICWENLMPLARQALYARGEQVHLAPTADTGAAWQSSLRHIAYEGRVFVVSCCQVLHRTACPDDPALAGFPSDASWLMTGGSAIVTPAGACDYLAGPVYGEETILYADLDLSRVVEAKHSFDVAGHYARPDIFELRVNRKPQAPLVDLT
jgi:nitrilase